MRTPQGELRDDALTTLEVPKHADSVGKPGAGSDDDLASLAAALAPLLDTVQEDLSVSALIIKQSSGG